MNPVFDEADGGTYAAGGGDDGGAGEQTDGHKDHTQKKGNPGEQKRAAVVGGRGVASSTGGSRRDVAGESVGGVKRVRHVSQVGEVVGEFVEAPHN